MMRIPLREGREFGAIDQAGGAQVAVVNDTFARTWWPGEPAVGHQIKVGGPYRDGPLIEVAGVVGDVRQFGLDAEPLPEIYLPDAQRRDRGMAIVVRTDANPETLFATVRARVLALDPNLPVERLATFETSLGAGLARRRFSTLLLTLFAALAMLLAAVGIYGLLSYWARSREPEIAIRLALGARPFGILRWTSFHALRLSLLGILLGAGGGWAAARGLEGLLFGIPARNPAALVGAGLAVMLVAVAASAIPAWRAARVDPARRLHHG